MTSTCICFSVRTVKNALIRIRPRSKNSVVVFFSTHLPGGRVCRGRLAACWPWWAWSSVTRGCCCERPSHSCATGRKSPRTTIYIDSAIVCKQCQTISWCMRAADVTLTHLVARRAGRFLVAQAAGVRVGAEVGAVAVLVTRYLQLAEDLHLQL